MNFLIIVIAIIILKSVRKSAIITRVNMVVAQMGLNKWDKK